jgi:hypothetical protein
MSIKKRVGGPNHNIPWRQYKLSYPICPQTILAGTGIPEESGGFRRNLQESGSNAGIYRNLCKIPVNKAKNRNFLTPAKRRFL